jgi:dipeptidyl aminopeptidase/acylaminoacyl peptidase
VATHFDAGQPEGDAIDRVSSRPDFVILAYPVITFDPTITHAGSRRNLIGEKPDPQWVEFFSNEKHVTKDTPPVFLFHTTADTVVPVENAIRFYHACRKAGVPVEMHIYEKGKHGVGLGRDPKWTGGETSVATWPDRLVDWLKSRQLLPSP